MKTTTSRDGTRIAYEELGQGPPVVLVDGAFCRRAFGPMAPLAALLAPRFTVFHYDRRGRGDSGDTPPYAAEREVEDLAAVVEEAASRGDGRVDVYGCSSGAALALRGAASGLPVKQLALYEPPFALDGTHTPRPADFREQIAAMVASGRRADAVDLFGKVVGAPAIARVFMRYMPGIARKLRDVAHTLPYDFAVLGDTQSGGAMPAELREKLGSIQAPTLAMAGGKSPPWMHHAARKVAESVARGVFAVVPGQDHNVAAKAIAPRLIEAFTS